MDLTQLVTQRDAELARVEQLVVQTEDDYAMGGGILGTLKVLWKRGDGLRKEATKPHRDETARINAQYDLVLDPIKHAITRVDTTMQGFRRLVREQKEKEQAKFLRLATKKSTGQIPEVIVPIVPPQEKSIHTETGTLTYKQVPQWEMVDESKLPYEFWMVDTAKIGKLVKAGAKAKMFNDAIKIWFEETPSFRGNVR